MAFQFGLFNILFNVTLFIFYILEGDLGYAFLHSTLLIFSIVGTWMTWKERGRS